MQICVDVGRLEVYRDTLKRAFGASAYMAIAECLVQTVLLTDDAGNPDVVSTAVLPKIPHSNSCKRVPNRPLRPRRPYYPAEADLEFQARACNTLAFGAVARSAAHRHRARRPAHWPRERTGAHTATMPWRSGRAAAKGVPLPQPQRRWPASVARRPREAPSLRRAAHVRTASGAAGVHGETLQQSLVPDAILDRATQTWITRIRDSSRFAHSFFLLGALLLAHTNEWMKIV